MGSFLIKHLYHLQNLPQCQFSESFKTCLNESYCIRPLAGTCQAFLGLVLPVRVLEGDGSFYRVGRRLIRWIIMMISFYLIILLGP